MTSYGQRVIIMVYSTVHFYIIINFKFVYMHNLLTVHNEVTYFEEEML